MCACLHVYPKGWRKATGFVSSATPCIGMCLHWLVWKLMHSRHRKEARKKKPKALARSLVAIERVGAKVSPYRRG